MGNPHVSLYGNYHVYDESGWLDGWCIMTQGLMGQGQLVIRQVRKWGADDEILEENLDVWD